MHLILGAHDDPCCTGVHARLRERGVDAHLLSQPLVAAGRFSWCLDDTGADSRLEIDRSATGEISSVLVRDAGVLSPVGWKPSDHAYMQAEIRATLLAWLESLPCPVVNRMPAAIWYRPLIPLLEWLPLLRRAGLPVPEVLLTSDPAEARNFSRRLNGALCIPLTSDASWIVTERDWPGLARLQAFAPVCLTEAHGATWPACVIGDRVIWDGEPPAAVVALAPQLRRFADLCGLSWFEADIASARRGLAVTMIATFVQFDHFQDTARERIVDALADILTGGPSRVRQREQVPL